MGRAPSEQELMDRILAEHRRDPHPGLGGERLRLHVAIHSVVETQLAEDEPPETAATLARLLSEGLDRHQAVHAIGSVVASEVFEVLQEGRRYDEGRYRAALRELSAERFRSPSSDPLKKQ